MASVMDMIVAVCSVVTTTSVVTLTWAVLRSIKSEARHMPDTSAPAPLPHPPAGDGAGRTRREREFDVMPVDVP